MKLAYAILYTADLNRAVSYYRESLDLRVIEISDAFASLSLDNCILGIKVSSEPREVPGAQTVILSSAKIQALYERVLGSGGDLVTPMNNAEWGRNFAIADPDGNKVEFVEDISSSMTIS